MFMLNVRIGVLILFTGRPFTTDALHVNRVLPAQLGGDVTFDIAGASTSQCKTHEGRLVVECQDKTTMEGIQPGFQNRIGGSCDHIKLKDVQKEDHMFICENLDHLKPASYNYYIKATTAPPQNVSLSINGSKVSVLWKPPPADWQTGPILEYEVKMFCNGTELLMNKTTVSGNSTVLEGLPQEVWCTVSVAAVTSDGVEAWSEPTHVDLPPSGSSQNNMQPVEEGKSVSSLVVSLMSVGSLVSLAFLVWFLRKRCGNSGSGPKPKAEKTENGYSPVHITQSHLPHDVENQM